MFLLNAIKKDGIGFKKKQGRQSNFEDRAGKISTADELGSHMLSIPQHYKSFEVTQSEQSSEDNLTDNNTNVNNSDIKCFEVQIAEPHKFWKPKEYITGTIILRLAQDAYNVALKFSVVNEIDLKVTKATRVVRKKKEIISENSTYLYGDEANLLNLSKGQHKFPFKFKLPRHKKSFTSIDFEKGSNAYFIRGIFLGNNNIELGTCQKKISVLVPLDVGQFSNERNKIVVLQSTSSVGNFKDSHTNSINNGEAASSFMTKLTKSSSNSNVSKNDNNDTHATTNHDEKTVKISVNLPHTGFTVGEIIPIKVNISHYKEFNHSAGVIATLTRICRVNGSTKDAPVETYRKDICQSTSPLFIDSDLNEATLMMYLKVPLDCFTTFTAVPNYFTFQYYIEVLVNLSKKLTIYTTSNKVVGKPLDNISHASHSRSLLKENISSLQAGISKFMQNNETFIDHNENALNISYNDMVNVERLKRSRNVTGMSIEIVIGSVRTKKPISPVSSTLEETNNEGSAPSLHNTEVLPSHNDHTFNEWLISTDPYESGAPTPTYTANEHVKVTSDKLELEHQRLKELESDPPLF